MNARNSLVYGPLRLHSISRLRGVLVASLLLIVGQHANSGSATWNLNPTNGDWNTAANWTPQTVPNGPSDTATFGLSNAAALSLSSSTEVNGIVFGSGANGFTISITLNNIFTLTGFGLTNDSGWTQQCVTAGAPIGFGEIEFTNNATAGDMNAFTNNGGVVSNGSGGHTIFRLSSSAGSSSYINNGSSISALGG